MTIDIEYVQGIIQLYKAYEAWLRDPDANPCLQFLLRQGTGLWVDYTETTGAPTVSNSYVWRVKPPEPKRVEVAAGRDRWISSAELARVLGMSEIGLFANTEVRHLMCGSHPRRVRPEDAKKIAEVLGYDLAFRAPRVFFCNEYGNVARSETSWGAVYDAKEKAIERASSSPDHMLIRTAVRFVEDPE